MSNMFTARRKPSAKYFAWLTDVETDETKAIHEAIESKKREIEELYERRKEVSDPSDVLAIYERIDDLEAEIEALIEEYEDIQASFFSRSRRSRRSRFQFRKKK